MKAFTAKRLYCQLTRAHKLKTEQINTDFALLILSKSKQLHHFESILAEKVISILTANNLLALTLNMVSRGCIATQKKRHTMANLKIAAFAYLYSKIKLLQIC